MHIIPLMNGVYLLVMALKKDTILQIGKLGRLRFKNGCYVYVGSAQSGLEQRLARHLRAEKKSHWHIDYFLASCNIQQVFYKETSKKEECSIAQLFKKNCDPIPGFGSSDCSCISHLFCSSTSEILQITHKVEMKPYRFHTNH